MLNATELMMSHYRTVSLQQNPLTLDSGTSSATAQNIPSTSDCLNPTEETVKTESDSTDDSNKIKEKTTYADTDTVQCPSTSKAAIEQLNKVTIEDLPNDEEISITSTTSKFMEGGLSSVTSTESTSSELSVDGGEESNVLKEVRRKRIKFLEDLKKSKESTT